MPVDTVWILTRDEIYQVLHYLHRGLKRRVHKRLNLTIFRLSCCLGLRAKEIAGLTLADVVVEGARPIIRIRKEITKGVPGKKRARLVPLWWDKGTLKDITAWYELRMSETNDLNAPFVCSRHAKSFGKPLDRNHVGRHWRTALFTLGRSRVRQVSVHKGRHTFCSHALAAGRSLAEIAKAAGHANIATTSIYLHAMENSQVRDLFAFTEKKKKRGRKPSV